MFASLTREAERIDLADLTARGFIQGTKPIHDRATALQLRVTAGPLTPTIAEELSKHADDLWNQHEKALKSRPVS